MGQLERTEVVGTIQEELENIIRNSPNPRRSGRTFWPADNRNPYIVMPPGQELSGEEINELAYMLLGLDLEPAWDVISAKFYSRITFRQVEREQHEKPLPPLGRRTVKDYGTSPYSDVNPQYRKYFYEKYIKPKHPGPRGCPRKADAE